MIVAIVGASSNRLKYGNRAVRAFVRRGHTVVPVNPHESEIEGLKAYPSLLDVPGRIDMVSLYVPPIVGRLVLEDAAKKGVGEVWLNPGAESPDLIARARELNLRTVVACSIMSVGEDPHEL